jgi:hypothetical protein
MSTTERIDLLPPEPLKAGFAQFLKFYPDSFCLGQLTRVTETAGPEGASLLERLSIAYRHAHESHPQVASGVWQIIDGHKAEIHRAAMAGDLAALGEFLRRPASSMLFHGFDQPTINSIKHINNVGWLTNYRALSLGSLRRLAEAMGALPMIYPEGFGIEADVVSNTVCDTETILNAIEAELGVRLAFPNPFIDELGLETPDGTASYRAIQSAYQAWRLAQLANRHRAVDTVHSALEIGGGTGRTAFQAFRLGIEDYTIVDLPTTSLVQGYFLGMALGPDRICLEGEPMKERSVKLVSPPALLGGRSWDIAASFDALVEFSENDAASYIDFIIANACALLSINRESKSYTVRSLLKARGLIAQRSPCWTRHGYAEELLTLPLGTTGRRE